MKNKKGWLKIIEAFIAVFIIMSVGLFVVNKNYIQERDISEKIYAAEVQLLQEVIDEYGKGEIVLAIDENGEIVELVNNRKPEYLECYLQYYSSGFEWYYKHERPEKQDIYVQTLPILSEEFSTEDLLIRIACWLA